MGYADNHLCDSLLPPKPLGQLGKEAGQAWAQAPWMRWMPKLWLCEHQPPLGNPLYTIAVAAEVGREMRFELLGCEALMAFPGPQ